LGPRRGLYRGATSWCYGGRQTWAVASAELDRRLFGDGWAGLGGAALGGAGEQQSRDVESSGAWEDETSGDPRDVPLPDGPFVRRAALVVSRTNRPRCRSEVASLLTS
jgi:hypothetical protein